MTNWLSSNPFDSNPKQLSQSMARALRAAAWLEGREGDVYVMLIEGSGSRWFEPERVNVPSRSFEALVRRGLLRHKRSFSETTRERRGVRPKRVTHVHYEITDEGKEALARLT